MPPLLGAKARGLLLALGRHASSLYFSVRLEPEFVPLDGPKERFGNKVGIWGFATLYLCRIYAVSVTATDHPLPVA